MNVVWHDVYECMVDTEQIITQSNIFPIFIKFRGLTWKQIISTDVIACWAYLLYLSTAEVLPNGKIVGIKHIFVDAISTELKNCR